MKLVTVAPLSKTVRKDALSYFSAKDIPVGSIVSVPVRGKNIPGIAIDSKDAILSKADLKRSDFSLKKVSASLGFSVLPESFFAACKEAEDLFFMAQGAIVARCSPASWRERTRQESPPKRPAAAVQAEKLVLQLPLAERLRFYKLFIRESFARKESVFIVVPSRKDIPLFEEALSKGIEGYVETLDGAMTKRASDKALARAMEETHPLLYIGTPLYAAIPKADIGAFIIEKEHARHYRGIAKPHIDMRMLIEAYAALSGAKLVRADTILSTETLGRRDEGAFADAVPISFRKAGGPEETVVPMGAARTEEPGRKTRWKLFAEESIGAVREALGQGKRVMLFSLRPGIAHATVCSNCDSIVSCDACDAPLALKERKRPLGTARERVFICPRCQTAKDAKITCGTCGNWNLVPLGAGTDRVAAEAAELFPDAPIVMLDAEHAKTDKQREAAALSWRAQAGSVLIATEAALPYLEEKAGVTVVVSFDSLFSIPAYRASDRIVHLLSDLADATAESLVIQTRNTDDPALLAYLRNGLSEFFRSELKDRRMLSYPPYARLIKISWEGTPAHAPAAKERLAAIIGEYRPAIAAAKPSKKNHAAWSAVFRAEDGRISAGTRQALKALPQPYIIETDPDSLV